MSGHQDDRKGQQPQNGEGYEYNQMKKSTEKHKSGQHRQQFDTEQELHQEDGKSYEYDQMKRSSKKPKCGRPLQTDRLDEEYQKSLQKGGDGSAGPQWAHTINKPLAFEHQQRLVLDQR